MTTWFENSSFSDAYYRLADWLSCQNHSFVLIYGIKTWIWQISMYLFPYEGTNLTVVTDFVCSV